MKILLSTLMIALLAGCATVPDIDRTYNAKGQSSRVKFLIVHYTVSNLPQSINILTNQTVSSHYLLTDEATPRVYGLVDESRQANHAGVSNWKNYTLLNGSSVGIEIVNPGFTEGPNGRVYYPFPQPQIDRLIVLMKEIVARHQIPPENILGHSDIAPTRKQDPGPMFPWAQLAKHGLVQWPNAERVAAVRPLFDQYVPDVTWFQQKLALHGYAVPQSGTLDAATRAVVSAFQMKYRPAAFDGTPDAETATLLAVLTTPSNKPIEVPAPPILVPPVEAPALPMPSTVIPPVPTPAAVPAPLPLPVPPKA